MIVPSKKKWNSLTNGDLLCSNLLDSHLVFFGLGLFSFLIHSIIFFTDHTILFTGMNNKSEICFFLHTHITLFRLSSHLHNRKAESQSLVHWWKLGMKLLTALVKTNLMLDITSKYHLNLQSSNGSQAFNCPERSSVN